jgi:hypothetical protein
MSKFRRGSAFALSLAIFNLNRRSIFVRAAAVRCQPFSLIGMVLSPNGLFADNHLKTEHSVAKELFLNEISRGVYGSGRASFFDSLRRWILEICAHGNRRNGDQPLDILMNMIDFRYDENGHKLGES